MNSNPLYSRLPLSHCPNWFRPMLESLGAHVVQDSDSFMWYHRKDRFHLIIDTDKILMYAEGNPLQYRTFYDEKFENEWSQGKPCVAATELCGCNLCCD